MKVSYDRKNDVVTIYLEKEDHLESCADEKSPIAIEERDYEVEEAAGLLLDMVDILDSNGKLLGFRVFNASNYYDIALLESADHEELGKEELLQRPVERVIKKLPKRP